MSESLYLTSVARMVEEILASTDPQQRDRILLDGAFELQAAQSAAVWRRVGAWRPVLERGPADALPAPGLVLGVLEDGLDRNLPGRAVVLHVEDSPTALVLGEVENPEGRVDLLEALLRLGSVLAEAETPSASESLEAPLPEDPPRGPRAV